MLIRAARQHSPIALLLIPLLGVLLWLPGFFFEYEPRPQVHMPLYALIGEFAAEEPLVSRIVALVLVFAQAAGFNYLVQRHQLLTRRSYLPALFFVVLSACTIGLLRLHPALLANVFLLPAVYLMLDTYRMDTAYSKIFYAGVLVSMASLVYFPALMFMFFLLACLVIMRPFIWREWVILLFGLLFPYVYAASWFFLTGASKQFWRGMILEPIVMRDFFLALPPAFYFLTATTALLLLTAAGRFIAGAGTATLKTRKGISCMLWMVFFSLLASLPAQDFGVTGFFFAAVPLSLFISNYFLLARRLWLAETLFILLLAGVVSAYWPYLKG